MEKTSLDEFVDTATAGEEDEPDGSAERSGSAKAGGQVERANGESTNESDSESTNVSNGESTSSANDEFGGEDASIGEANATPAVSTATWTPGGVACDGCGEQVQRRWSDDTGLVCGDCKDW